MSDAVTCDGFLGGRLKILQPATGYRAGIDPVLLAASVPARAGESVLELGCGVGVASLCLGWRVPGLFLEAVELQPDYAELARCNAARNGIPLKVTTSDFRWLPEDLRAASFDHVIANPPYYRRADGSPAAERGREASRGEDAPLSAWLDGAIRRLMPKGRLTMIHKAERLPDVLFACAARLGDIAVHPISARPGRAADRVIVTGRKASRAPFRLFAPLVVHEGGDHRAHGGDYTPEMREILRNGRRLNTGVS